MSEALAEIIREEIRREGPIPFSRWMDLCLYHPEHGYYMKERPAGRRITGPDADADFVTPPTLHPFFAVAVAKEMLRTWNRLGRPQRFKVLEWGGGEGDVARQALAWLDRNEPGFAAGVRWIHLDPSPLHRRAQGRSGDDRIGWLQDRDVDTGWGRHSKPDNVPEDPARFALLCEVLDACPFDLYERTATGWAELLVASDGVRFCETRRPLHSRSGGTADPTDLDDYLLFRSARAAAGLQPVPAFVGQRVADFHPAMDLLERAWDATRGTVLAVDYMEHPERLWVPERADFVRAYRGHALCSPLDDPGDADITATLDLAQVSFHVRGSILPDENEQLESLESFLLRHGILDELNRIDRSTVEGASSYLRLRQLLLPTGMGTAFKVQRFDRAA